MSPTTWTPIALGSEARPWRGQAWRVVEAQHVASTMKLVDGPQEQRVLELLLESSKPPSPANAPSLHYLLATPFRYPPLPGGSRFRGPGEPGVFYGGDHLKTACAELGYWRWRFLRDSPRLEQLAPMAQTAFQVAADTTAIDLREGPFKKDARRWTSPDDYRDTQALAGVARAADVGAIRFESVRDPDRGGCVALLTPRAFASNQPIGPTQTWWLVVRQQHVTWVRDLEHHVFRFGS